MGDLRWGMTESEVVSFAKRKIGERYAEQMKKADAGKQAKLKDEMKRAQAEVEKSRVAFEGTRSRWDSSPVAGEFNYGDDESMLVVKDDSSQNYYFFRDGRLWKWYKAFDAAVFPADSFATFASAVQRRFGPAKDAHGELAPGSGERHWLEWQDEQTRLRAVDQTDFYGFYCLVFEQKTTVANLAQLRSNTREVASKQHAMIEAVTAKGGAVDPDSSPDIADRISGNTRARSAPAASSSSGKGKKGSKAESEPAAAAAPTGVKDDDDPLRGLGL